MRSLYSVLQNKHRLQIQKKMKSILGYQLTEKLHESNNSIVYRAQRIADRDPVVLKLFREPFPSPEQIARFKREYEVTRQLDLAGVVEVYGLERYQNQWMMVLEDFGGDSLTRLGLAGQFEIADFLEFAVNVSHILAEVHARQIMHKDLNPSNLIFNPTSGELKLIDFGISTALSREGLRATFRHPNVLEGTLAYISPEQSGRMNRVIDYRTDFYSLGITFYELLTGQLPYQSDVPLELVHYHIAKEPIPPHQLNPHIPEALSQIVLKLIEKNAERRYQSAYGLNLDLAHCLVQLNFDHEIKPFILGREDRSDRLNIPQILYGRENEIKRLLTTFEDVASGQTQIMLVTGYSGVGKSALVQEIYRPVTEKRGYFITGKFDQFQRNIPYYAFRQAFQDFINLLLTEKPEILASWKEKILNAVGSLGQILIEVIPALQLIIGEQTETPRLSGTQSENRFNYVFGQFISAISQKEHPLVIFIDDLQWADPASLKMLQNLITNPQHKYLFLIGAYRDHEVSSSHPLMRMINIMQRDQYTIVQTLTLSPLSLAHISTLLVDTLHRDKFDVQPLAQIVYEKTKGNPFFVNQFLQSLHKELLLLFNYEQNQWQWDIDRINSLSVTANVVDLMARQIKNFPPDTKQVLSFAACIGNRFDLNDLAIIHNKTKTETADDLWEALNEGVISPLSHRYQFIDNEDNSNSSIQYCFIHDRVQQVAYSLIDDEERRHIQLQIGRLLLNKIPQEKQAERIFDIVNQFNVARNLIQESTEQIKLAQLNLEAGCKAKLSVAHKPALAYFKTGIGLLEQQDMIWQRHYQLALELYSQTAESAYLSDDFQLAEEMIEVVLRHSDNLSDRIHVYETKLFAQVAQGKLSSSIESGLEILRQLGVNLSSRTNKAYIVAGLLKTKWRLRNKSIENLTSLPQIRDQQLLLMMRILGHLQTTAYITSPDLLPLLIFKQIELSLKHGNCAFSPQMYGMYGLILCGVVGDVDTGYQFGELSLKLFDELEDKKERAKVKMVFYLLIHHWKANVNDSLQPLLDTYQEALQNGHFRYAILTIAGYFGYAYHLGQPLEELIERFSDYKQSTLQVSTEAAWNYLSVYQQTMLNLFEENQEPTRLVGQVYNEEEALLFKTEINDQLGLFFLFLNKLILSYLFHDVLGAIEYADKTEQYIEAALGLFYVPIFYFYDSLAQLSFAQLALVEGNLSKSEYKRILKKVGKNQKKIKKWADYAPMNHLHRYYLVEAERYRLLGEDYKARDYYDQAIAEAQRYEYINEEALACELAGSYHLSKERKRMGQLYLRDAYYGYKRWGAKAKVKQLADEYAYLLLKKEVRPLSSLTTSNHTYSSKTITQALDFTSVMKASQAISGEIDLAKLLSQLLKIVIENAGAQHGYLILIEEEQLLIQAQGSLDKEQIEVLQAIPLEQEYNNQIVRPTISSAIVNYVMRSREQVVLHDAAHSSQFQHDAYLTTQQPKSILCMPLINQTELLGMIYLENNLTTDAFTPERVNIMRLLGTQAAISISNAQAIQAQAQQEQLRLEKQLAEKANQAKSEFLSNMSHELRTPLNAVLGYAQILQREKEYDPAQVREAIKIIHQSGEHLLTLINDILDLSKIEAGKMELYSTEVDLHSFLTSIISIMRMKAEQKDLLFGCELDQTLPLGVSVDQTRLRQVLINLLSNAIKFTHQGQVILRVTLLATASSTTEPVATMRFEVCDSGVGISQKQIETIFLPFEQVGDKAYHNKGTGLGLAITRQLVSLMGGQIKAKSELGTGSTFWFDLQLPIISTQIKEESKPLEIIGYEGKVRTILIVDDDLMNRLVLRQMLAPLGFELIEAKNGQQGVKQAIELKPDLILMDVVMPVMSGAEAVKEIRQQAVGKQCAIIALSANLFAQEESLQAGCNLFLPKPVDLDQLLLEIEKLLQLTWHYAAAESEHQEQSISSLDDVMMPPSTEELAQLYQLAQLWDLMEIQERAYKLEQDAKLAPFARKLLNLADDFKGEEILTLIEQYLPMNALPLSHDRA